MTYRLQQALHKLYNAFNESRLNPDCCKQCAVGNILDNSDSWKHFSDRHGTKQLNYVGTVHERLGRLFNGYKPSELLATEFIFLKACGLPVPYTRKRDRVNKLTEDNLFEGLQQVTAYLCKLDGIYNPMDISVLLQDGLDKKRTKSLDSRRSAKIACQPSH